MPGPLSRRAYAARAGITEGAVRKAIRAGVIVPLADGTIDPDQADAALAARRAERSRRASLPAAPEPEPGHQEDQPMTSTTGMSRRAYAKARDSSPSAVRKAIKAGVIVPLPDGSIDPDQADDALGRRRAARLDNETMADVLLRESQSAVALNLFKMVQERDGLLTQAAAEAIWRRTASFLASGLFALARESADDVGGLRLDQVRALVHGRLAELATGPVERMPVQFPEPIAESEIQAMGEAAVAKLRAAVKADHNWIKLGVARKTLKPAALMLDQWAERLAGMRSRALSLVAEIAPLIGAGAATADTFRAGIADSAAMLAWEGVTTEELLALGKPPRRRGRSRKPEAAPAVPAELVAALATASPQAVAAAETDLAESRAAAVKPPPSMTVVQWADTYRRLSSSAGAVAGQWRTSRVAVARGPMMAVTEPGVRIITVMSATQLLKSSLLENVFGYFAHLDPCPMLLAEPKEEAAEAFSVERLVPMIQATPELRALVGDGRTRRTDNRIKFKRFPGGYLAIATAGSPSDLAMRAIRITLLDEIDKYDPTKEGDPVRLAEERTATFSGTALNLRVCSPTLIETSRIAASYAESDQRRAYIPCPHCGHEQVPEFFRSILWDKGEDDAAPGPREHDPETAAVHCESCGVLWTEPERLAALQGIRWMQTRPFTCCGERQEPMVTRRWRWDAENEVGRAVCQACGADAVPNRHAGFHAWKLHSPWDTMPELARKWIEAKNDPELRLAFHNTQLGLPMKFSDAATVTGDVLLARREQWATAPAGVQLITCGVDVQSGGGGRFEVETVGWGVGEESWSLGYDVIEGDLTSPETWDRLDQHLRRVWRTEDNRNLWVQGTCIDSGGHHTQAVYDFCSRRGGRRVWAIKGASETGNNRQPVWPPAATPRKWRKSGHSPILIGVNAAKDQINRRLAIADPGPGYCHFPADRMPGYFAQLTAEHLVFERRGGSRVGVWKLQKGRANEALDARVYAYAALCGLVHAKLQPALVAAGAMSPPPRSRAAPAPGPAAPMPAAPRVPKAPPGAPNKADQVMAALRRDRAGSPDDPPPDGGAPAAPAPSTGKLKVTRPKKRRAGQSRFMRR